MAKQLNVNLAFNADTSKAKAQIQELYQSLNNVTTSTAKLPITTQIQEAQSAAVQLKIAMSQAFDVNTGKLDLLKFNQSIKSSGTSLDQIKTKLVQIGPAGQQAFLSLAQSIAAAEIPAKRTSALLTNLGVTLKNTIKWQLSSSMLHGFMGAVQSAYGYAQNLNSSLNDIRIVTGLSADEMDKFAAKANKAAKSLSSSTLDYTNASLIYFQQGLNEKAVEERTNVTLKMANASGATAEKVSQQMTAVWNNFDDGSKSLEYYADVMTALGAATASSTDEISQGLQKFSAVASTVGLSYEYATSALATITATTRESADVVGTALKTLFARIQGLQQGDTLDDGTTLNKYSAALETVGISIKDTNGQMKDMDIILDEMGAKWKTLEKDQQLALAQTVAGVRQYTQLVALMDNWDFFEQNLGIANSAEGALQEQADIYAESWEAARKRVKAAAEAIYTDLLDDKFFIGLTNSIEKVLTMFDGFLDSIGGARGVLLGLSSILLNAFSGAAAKGLENMVYNFKSFVGIAQKEAIATQNEIMTLTNTSSFNAVQPQGVKTQEVTAVTATTNAMQSQLQITHAIAQQRENMSALQQQEAQALLEQNKMYGEQAIALAQKAEASQGQHTLLRDELLDLSANAQETAQILSSIDDNIEFGEKIKQEVKEAMDAFNNGEIEVEEYTAKIAALQKEAQKLGLNQTASRLKGIGGLTKANIQGMSESERKHHQSEVYAVTRRETRQQAQSKLGKQDLSTEQVDKYIQSQRQVAMATNSANEAIARQSENAGNAIKTIKGFTASTTDVSGSIVKATQATSSLAFALNSILNIGNIWSNENLTGGQKLLQTFTALATAAPMLMNALTGFKTVFTTMAGSQALLNAVSMQYAATVAATTEGITAEALAEQTGLSVKQAKIALATASSVAKLQELAATGALTGAEDANTIAEIANISPKQAGIILNKLKAGASLQTAMAEAGLTTSLWAQVAAWLALHTAMSPVMAVLVVVAATVAAAALAVWGFVAAWKAAQAASPEGQLKTAKEEAKSLADSLREAQQASQDLKDSFNDYDSAVSKLAECTEGTIEWQQALHEVNGEVLDLLNKYPELASMTRKDANGNEILGADGQPQKAITKDEKGNLKIEDWAREQMIQESQKAINNVQGAKTIADQRVREAQIKVDTNDLAAQIDRQARTTATTTIQGEVVDMGSQVARYIASNAAEFQGMSPEEQSAKLSEVFGQYDLDLEGWTSAIAELSGPMNSLVASIDANTAATRIENETLVSSALADNQQVQDSAYTSEIIKAAAWNGLDTEDQSDDTSKYQAVVDAKRAELENSGFGTAGINKGTGVNDKARQDFAEYAKAAGITDYDLIDTTGTDKNRNFVYTDAEGKEITVSLNKMIDVLANQEAQKQADIEANKVLDSLAEFEITDKDQKNLAEGLLNSGLGALTEEQKKQAQESGDIGSLFDQATLDNMKGAFEVIYGDEGVNKFNDWLNSLNEQIANWQPEMFNTESWQEQYAAEKDVLDDVEMGDTISAEDYGALSDAAKQYFVELADGTYRMIEDGNRVREIADQAQRDTLEQGAQDAKTGLSNVESNMQQSTGLNLSLDSWTQAAETGTIATEYQDDYINAVNEALGTQATTAQEAAAAVREYQTVANDTGSTLATMATSTSDLNNMLLNGSITAEQYQMGLKELGASYSNSQDEMQAYTNALESEDEATIKAAYDTLELATSAGELGEEYGYTGEEIESMAKQLKSQNKDLKTTGRAFSEMAKDQLRFNDALESSKENMKDWKKSVKAFEETGKLIPTEQIEEMRNAYGNLLDIDGSSLSEEFLTSSENLELMEKALDGNEDAYQELQALAGQEILQSVGIDTSKYESDLATLQGMAIDGKEWASIEAGASLNNAGFLNALTEMVNASGMTAQQATDYLSSMGVDAEVVEGDPVVTTEKGPASFDTQVNMVKENALVPVPDGAGGFTQEPIEVAFPQVTYTKGEQIEYEKETKGTGLKVISANKSSGGNVKASGGGGGGSKGGGGGGGNKSEKKKKADVVKKSAVVKRYKKVDDLIDDKQNAAEKASRAMDKMYGASRIKQMQKYNQLLQEEISLLGTKKSEAEDYLAIDEADLHKTLADASKELKMTGLEFEIDEDGLISNYDEVMTKLYEKLNNAITSANADGNADEDEQEKIDKIQEQIDAVTEAIEQYDETRELIEDIENDMAEKALELYDNQLEALSYEIELNLEVSDDSLALIEFQLSQIEDNAFKAAEAINLMGSQAATIEEKMAKTKEALASLTAMTLDGEYTQEQMDLIKEYRDELMKLAQEYAEIRKAVEEQVMAAFEGWREEMDRGISTVEHAGSVLASYKNITDLLGDSISEQTQNDLYSKFGEGIMSNAIDNIEATKAAYKGIQEAQARAQAEYDAAVARGDEASAEMWKNTLNTLNEEMNAAQENMLSAWEDALNTVVEQFEQSVERAVEAFRGPLDDLSDKFSRQKETSDMFLDDYAKIYELSKLSRDINKTIDDTESLGGKKKLKGLLEDINKLQEDGVEMSQYDLEYLQKTYDLRLAELELENAQNAKNTVRLSKDNEGNWSYVYTTNTDAVDQAQQKYEDALYAMQDLSSNYIDEMSEKLISTSQEMADALAALRVEDFASYQDYQDAVDAVTQEYQTKLELQEAELNKAIGNNAVLYETDWKNYADKTDYKISKTSEFVTAFRDSLLGSLMDSTTKTSNFMEVLAGSAKVLVDSLGAGGKEYFENIGAVMEAAGTSTDAFGKDATAAINETTTASQQAGESVKTMAADMVDSFDTVADSVVAWQAIYSEKITQALEDTESLVAMINAMNAGLVGGDGIPEGVSVTTGTSNSTNDSSSDTTGTSNSTNDASSGATTGETTAVTTAEYNPNTSITDNIVKQLVDMDLNKMNPETLKFAMTEVMSSIKLEDYNNLEEYFAAIDEVQSQYAEALENITTGQPKQEEYQGQWSKLVETLQGAPQMLSEAIPAAMLPTLTEVIEKIGTNASLMSLGVGQWAAQVIKDEFIQTLEQEVSIMAEFPNVSDHNEIEEAIRNLINTASQYANRK